MICKFCGKEIADDSAVCNYCAKPVEKEVEVKEEKVVEPIVENSAEPKVENVAQVASVNESATSNQDKEESNKKSANRLALLSLLFWPGIAVIVGVVAAIFPKIMAEAIIVASPTYLVSLVLMIVARVKSSKSILAKCVMWLHIIMVIAAFIFIIYAFKECMDSCSNGTW